MEDASEEAAAGQEKIQLLLGDRFTAARAAKTPPHRAQNDKIDAGNGEQEGRRGSGADDAADRLEFAETVLESERCRRDCRDGECNGQRMAEGKEQADGKWPFAFGHQLAHDVVDRGDVVGIDGVPQAEHVSE